MSVTVLAAYYFILFYTVSLKCYFINCTDWLYFIFFSFPKFLIYSFSSLIDCVPSRIGCVGNPSLQQPHHGFFVWTRVYGKRIYQRVLSLPHTVIKLLCTGSFTQWGREGSNTDKIVSSTFISKICNQGKVINLPCEFWNAAFWVK